MTIQELETQLLNLNPTEKLHLITVLAQSLLSHPEQQQLNPSSVPSSSNTEVSIVEFFRSSPLCEVADELDLTRDKSPVPDRIVL